MRGYPALYGIWLVLCARTLAGVTATHPIQVLPKYRHKFIDFCRDITGISTKIVVYQIFAKIFLSQMGQKEGSPPKSGGNSFMGILFRFGPHTLTALKVHGFQRHMPIRSGKSSCRHHRDGGR